jgi:hypothetical protein
LKRFIHAPCGGLQISLGTIGETSRPDSPWSEGLGLGARAVVGAAGCGAWRARAGVRGLGREDEGWDGREKEGWGRRRKEMRRERRMRKGMKGNVTAQVTTAVNTPTDAKE